MTTLMERPTEKKGLARVKAWIPGLNPGLDAFIHRARTGLGKPISPLAGMDPRVLGFDLQQYDTAAIISQQTDHLDYSSSGNEGVALDKNMFITGIMLVADPFRHDVTTSPITVVQDAVDKLFQGLTIVGGPTYFSLNSSELYFKGIGNLNKVVFGGAVTKEDLATAVGADNDSYQAWWIGFGAKDDYHPFDITAGIPAELQTSLNLNATFAANQVIAQTAANGTIDTATDVYVVLFGVQGLPREYLERAPIPEYRHDHKTSPTSETRFQLLGSRYLKRSTVVNLAAQASNNRDRNDSNITDVSFEIKKPVRTRVWDQVRWRVWKAAMYQLMGRGLEADKDGAVALAAGGLDGVAVIDWRKLTGNPYGLDLSQFTDNDAELIFTMGTTTGSIHIFHEYYTFRDIAIPQAWPAYRPQ
ncbi:MAG: hypothetical protein GWN58_28545 [Anaerolineae bacterium]|nr:hypothetical protein [Anaerolineae bacterium]